MGSLAFTVASVGLDSMPGGEPVASSAAGEHLVDQRHVSLVLRLVVDRSQQLVRGEVLTSDGASAGTFRDWPALIKLIEQSLQTPGI